MLTNEARQVLALLLDAAKSSVKKFAAIVEGTSPDGRLRGQFKYYGAHTGRWSGRGAQPQNLPHVPTDEKELKNLIRRGMVPTLNTLSTCIRPVISSKPGYKLVVADLSAFEPRVLGWLSGCDSMLDIYKEGKDPYKDFATRLLNIKYEDVTKAQRQMGKPPVLACGYGVGPGQERLLANGTTTMTGLRKYAEGMSIILPAALAIDMVQTFRRSFVEVTDYWHFLQEAFYAACKSKKRQQVGAVYLGATADAVYSELPSSRRIFYLNPRAWKGSKGLEIRYEGLNAGHWFESISTWGGSLTGHVVQSVARDVLVEGLLRAESEGLNPIGTCHDEIICEVPERMVGGPERLVECMTADIPWAVGLPLAAEGWEGKRYAKQ